MPGIHRCAVVGVGSAAGAASRGGGFQIGYTHAAAYERNPRASMKAAADINVQNLAAFQAKFDVSHVFTDYRQMLKEVRPDVVSLCTYVGLRRKMIEDCAAAGVKAVIAEKPLLASPVECAAVRKLVENTGLKIVVAHARRYLPAMQRAWTMIQAGDIGQPRLVATAVKGWDLNEMGAHWFDLIRYFNSDQPISWVFGQARVGDQRGFGHAMEQHAMAYFQLQDGTRGLIDGGVEMPGPDNFTIVGAEGVIHIIGEDTVRMENRHGQVVEQFAGVSPIGWELIKLQGNSPADWEKPWDCLLRDTLDWVDGGTEPITGFTSSIQTCEATLAAYASAVVGDRVDLPFTGKAAMIDEYPVEILARRAKEV